MSDLNEVVVENFKRYSFVTDVLSSYLLVVELGEYVPFPGEPF